MHFSLRTRPDTRSRVNRNDPAALTARRSLDGATPGTEAFLRGKLAAAQYWIATELPRAGTLAALCRTNDDSYARMRPDWF